MHLVIAPKDKSAPLNATASKVACGAAEAIPYIQVTNLARTLKDLQERGIWIGGTAGEAENSIYQQSLTGPIALVMGAEGAGPALPDAYAADARQTRPAGSGR